MPMLKMLTASILTVATLSSPPVRAEAPVRNAILVHGAVMDGSGWRSVYDILVVNGFKVAVVQLPLTGLDDDVAETRRVIDRQDGPVVLVGSSYGGAVISVAGTDPKVKALVYVAALQPDQGESVVDLNARWPMVGHPKDLGNGTMIVDPAYFAADVAADLPTEEAAFLSHSQRPTAFAAFTTKLPRVAWRDKPSFGIVATQDKTLSPDMERFMYKRSGADIVEIKASHLPHISQPQAVADVIIRALVSQYP
jgi:pimeloyl-ACP methyl ester carboxylesterase